MMYTHDVRGNNSGSGCVGFYQDSSMHVETRRLFNPNLIDNIFGMSFRSPYGYNPGLPSMDSLSLGMPPSDRA